MKQYKYSAYEDYREAQIDGNLSNLDGIFIQRQTLDTIVEKLQMKLGKVNTGICHGTRGGFEQKYLREKLNAEVIGTEISYTAPHFPHTIQWDFHEVKEEWLNSIDFIYSNSFDHSFDPAMCLDKWLSCLRLGGYCILHWTIWHLKTSPRQVFGATLGEYIELAMPIVSVDGDEKRLKLASDRYIEEVCRVDHSKVRRYGPDYLIWVKKT